MKRILLAVDGSTPAQYAVEEVARAGWPEGTIVRIVSVAEFPDLSLPSGMPHQMSSYAGADKAFEERAEENLTQAISTFAEIAGADIEVISKVLRGDPKSAILDEAKAWRANLIAVGTHGYNAFERFWLGSVSRAIVAHANCSVLISRKPHHRSNGNTPYRVLLCVDGSEFGDRAVKEVATRKWARDTEIKVVSVADLSFATIPNVWALPDNYFEEIEQLQRHQATKALGNAMEQLTQLNKAKIEPVRLYDEIVTGPVKQSLLDFARENEISLIVAGSHGRHGFDTFLMGSVSQGLAFQAPCSVLIVRKDS